MHYKYLQEVPEGKVAALWKEKLTGANLPTVDAASGLAQVFATKDASEVADARRSAFFAPSVLSSGVTPPIETPPPPPSSLKVLPSPLSQLASEDAEAKPSALLAASIMSSQATPKK